MKVYPTSVMDARWDITSSIDLSAATVRVKLGDTWYPADWSGPSTSVGAVFVRTAELVVGGADSAQPAKVLEGEQSLVEVTANGRVLVTESSIRWDID